MKSTSDTIINTSPLKHMKIQEINRHYQWMQPKEMRLLERFI
jgi:hypothetical protein